MREHIARKCTDTRVSHRSRHATPSSAPRSIIAPATPPSLVPRPNALVCHQFRRPVFRHRLDDSRPSRSVRFRQQSVCHRLFSSIARVLPRGPLLVTGSWSGSRSARSRDPASAGPRLVGGRPPQSARQRRDCQTRARPAPAVVDRRHRSRRATASETRTKPPKHRRKRSLGRSRTAGSTPCGVS